MDRLREIEVFWQRHWQKAVGLNAQLGEETPIRASTQQERDRYAIGIGLPVEEPIGSMVIDIYLRPVNKVSIRNCAVKGSRRIHVVFSVTKRLSVQPTMPSITSRISGVFLIIV